MAAKQRRDVVIVMIQYDGDVPPEILDIHEAANTGYEGVVRVTAAYGAEPGQVATALGSAPARWPQPQG